MTTTYYTPLTPATSDTVLPDAVRAIAAMIGQVLDPYGVTQSVPLAAQQVDVSPDSGVFVEHVAFAGNVNTASECADWVLGTLHSRYYVRPFVGDPAEAMDAVLALLVPIIRAHRKHLELQVGTLPIGCRMTAFQAGKLTRGEGETAQHYYGVNVTCELTLYVLEPTES